MVKREMIRKFLQDALAGESQAHVKYSVFAEQAEKEGKKNLARMWRAISHAEYVHARNHIKALGYLNSTEENLVASYNGEDFEVDEMYNAYMAAAEVQNEPDAKRTIRFALEAEKIHSEMYKSAKEKIAEGNDIEDTKFYICPVCGYTATLEDLPEKCPVCGAAKETFTEF